MSTAIITTIPDIPTTTIMNNNHKYNSEDEEDEKPIQPQQQQQQQDEEEDNKFDVSSLVTQVQQTSSGHRQYSHHQQPPIQRRTTPMILKKTDQATYSDDHISSTTIYDEEEVVVDEATTVSHQPKQACTTTTVTSTTTSTIIKHEKKHISKRKRFINNLFKPITRCFQQSSKSPSTPEKQKTPTKHQQTTKPQQLQPQDEEALAADVDVVDVETYEQTTTTVVTTTVQTQPPHNTSNNNNNAAQKLKKKKKKKKRSPHDSRSSLAAHSSRGKSKTLLGPQSQQLTGRKTLVLDLDETLVHSKFEPVAGADFQIPIDIEGRQHIVYVMKRPGVDEFLEEMGKIYEVIIFTASLSKYANPLLDQLDKKKVITGRLFREHCTYVDQCYIKDMSRLGRDIDSALIIDNSPACYAFQPRNAMPCTSWFDDQNDTELLQMIPWLQKLSQERTVYETLDQWRQYFGANCQWY